MSTVSLRLSDKDDALIRKFAELHNMDLSSFIRQAVLEKIEDEYDLELFDKFTNCFINPVRALTQ